MNELTHRQRRTAEINGRETLHGSSITILDDLRAVAEIAAQYFAQGMASIAGVELEPVKLEKHQILRGSIRT